MRAVSKKQASVNREIKVILNELIVEHDFRCSGCGRGGVRLTPSHIIRRSKRPDLITCKRNIKPHCVDCHHKWDSGVIIVMMQLRDFNENMEFIKEVDPQYYNRLTEKQ